MSATGRIKRTKGTLIFDSCDFVNFDCSDTWMTGLICYCILSAFLMYSCYTVDSAIKLASDIFQEACKKISPHDVKVLSVWNEFCQCNCFPLLDSILLWPQLFKGWITLSAE